MAKAAIQKPADQIKVVDTPEFELAALGTMLKTLDSVQPDTRRRAFFYLKSKYSAEWPRDSDGY